MGRAAVWLGVPCAGNAGVGDCAPAMAPAKKRIARLRIILKVNLPAKSMKKMGE
jgi:hypothetical protein